MCRGDGGASEKQLQALAIYMGHSVEMQRNTYDRRSKAEKVTPSYSPVLQPLRKMFHNPSIRSTLHLSW